MKITFHHLDLKNGSTLILNDKGTYDYFMDGVIKVQSAESTYEEIQELYKHNYVIKEKKEITYV